MAFKVAMKPHVMTLTFPQDPEGQTTATVKQATTGDLVRLGNVFSKQTQVYKDGEVGTVRLEKDWNPEELKRERAFSTLVGCDLEWEAEKPEDEDKPRPVFTFRDTPNGPKLTMSRVEFNRAWDNLPPELTETLYDFVLEANPIWNPLAVGESQAT